MFVAEGAVEADDDQSVEGKFVEHVKELGVDTKDVLLHTAANVQHVLETAGDYIRTQLSSNSTEDTPRMARHHEQNDFLHQAAVFKHMLVQKEMNIKDATIYVIKDNATVSGQE